MFLLCLHKVILDAWMDAWIDALILNLPTCISETLATIVLALDSLV